MLYQRAQKKGIRKTKNKTTITKKTLVMVGVCQGNKETNYKSSQGPKLEQFEQENEILRDYNTKYKHS